MSNANCTTVAGVQRCQCISGRRYSIIYGACIEPISYNESCLATADCINNLVCSSVNGAYYCVCGSDAQYYSSLNSTCLDKALYNAACSAFGPYCDEVRLLECNSFGNCSCPSAYYFSTTTARCEARIFPGNACTSTSSCITNADCVSNICECVTGSYYFDTTTGECVALKSYGTACTEHEQCQTTLYCVSDICQCTTGEYYTGTFCDISATITEACDNVVGPFCDTSVDLVCDSTTLTCLCSSDSYWNSSSCIERKYLYESCTSALECPQNGTCTANICKCTTTTYYNATLNSCVSYSTYGQTCYESVFVTSECSPTQNLECSSTTSGTCQCSSSNYYASTTATCTAKVTQGGACSASILCDDSLGLTCVSNVCQCSSGTYWTGSKCSETKGAGQACTAASECTSPMSCISSICNCPATFYLDLVTVACLSKKASGVSCTYNFECTSSTCTNSVCT